MADDVLHQAEPGEERFALLHSDGSMGILCPGASIEDAERERGFADGWERDRRHMSKILRLRLPAWEVVASASAEAPAMKDPMLAELRGRIDNLEVQRTHLKGARRG